MSIEKQCVWIGTITDDESDYGKPLVYVAYTEEALMAVMRAAYDAELVERRMLPMTAATDDEWLELLDNSGVMAYWSYYGVE